ncbi:hypothetical protein [Neolewinella agarilytica]|uniref:hypothetical protein n=1 Tax=Neolewinella agarilytica TaxID=478744 RepID=UPI002356045D|nr:hypothetical protein [Neolewinella agarilytica]
MNSYIDKVSSLVVGGVSKAIPVSHIFITCTPKSASTYLMRLLGGIVNAKVAVFIDAFDHTEQDMSINKIIENMFSSTVTHQHMRYSNYNAKVLDRFGIKPIILTRNIYDSVVSMRDHILREPKVVWWPMAAIDVELFRAMSDERQIDFVIDHIVPWYVNFYVSWDKVYQEREILWITYKELMEDKVNTLNNILAYYDFKEKVSRGEIEEVENKIFEKVRFNKGTMNRGISLMSERQINKILGLVSYYPDIDFSKMGV